MGNNPAWKKFEVFCGYFFGGARFKANTGGGLDFESETAVGQCKLTKVLSLEELTKLAEYACESGNTADKLGVVMVKVRRGTGKRSAALVVMTTQMFDLYFSMKVGQPPIPGKGEEHEKAERPNAKCGFIRPVHDRSGSNQAGH